MSDGEGEENVELKLKELEEKNQEIEDRASLIRNKSYGSKNVSNDFIIDFNSENTGWNQKQNWYCTAVAFAALFTAVGIILNVTAWSTTKQNQETIDKFFAAFLNRSRYGFKCYSVSDPTNPCNNDPDGVSRLYNWQLEEYYSGTPGELFPCLEITGQMTITPNYTDPNRISFSDATHLFSLSSLVFSNTVVSSNDQIADGISWLQSNIRTLPGTYVRMNQANLKVEPGNLYAIQPPVMAYHNQLADYDYCQISKIQNTGLAQGYPIFMYFNSYISQANGTIPSFTICTCVQGFNNTYVSMCLDGNSFTRTT